MVLGRLILVGVCILSWEMSGCNDDTLYTGSNAQVEDDNNDIGDDQDDDIDDQNNDDDGCSEPSDFSCVTCDIERRIGEPVCEGSQWVCPEGYVPPFDCEFIEDPPPCGGSAFDVGCVDFCGSDVVEPSVCDGGQWVCPDGMIEESTCGPNTCTGLPEVCCLEPGGSAITPDCVEGRWECDWAQCASGDMDGQWEETGRIDCETGETFVSQDPAAELILFGADEFSMTFASGLFETFRHYWGSYVYIRGNSEGTRGELRISIEGGNFIPEASQYFGTVTWLEAPAGLSRILIEDMILEQPDPIDEPRPCGYYMERR